MWVEEEAGIMKQCGCIGNWRRRTTTLRPVAAQDFCSQFPRFFKESQKARPINSIRCWGEFEADYLRRLGSRNISVGDEAQNREDRSSERIKNSQFVIREQSYQMATTMTFRA